jgi:hypothetical protein
MCMYEKVELIKSTDMYDSGTLAMITFTAHTMAQNFSTITFRLVWKPCCWRNFLKFPLLISAFDLSDVPVCQGSFLQTLAPSLMVDYFLSILLVCFLKYSAG